MSEQEKQEGQKTVVAFVSGLLIGGLLVWIFSGSTNEELTPADIVDENSTELVEETGSENGATASETETTPTPEPEAPTLTTGDGRVEIDDQTVGNVVTFDSVTFPIDEGWIAVRSYNEEQLGNILGASRFSKSQGLVPESVQLLTPTVAERTYAIVFFTEDGDRTFNPATDVQIEGVFATFTAQ